MNRTEPARNDSGKAHNMGGSLEGEGGLEARYSAFLDNKVCHLAGTHNHARYSCPFLAEREVENHSTLGCMRAKIRRQIYYDYEIL